MQTEANEDLRERLARDTDHSMATQLAESLITASRRYRTADPLLARAFLAAVNVIERAR